MANEKARLRKRLHEDTGRAPGEDDTLVEALATWQAPHPDADERATLLQWVHEALPSTYFAGSSRREWLVAFMRAQLRVVQHEIWWASMLVMALGIVVSLVTIHMTAPGSELPFVLVAPLVAACGLALIYDTGDDSAAEIERATPTAPALILLARMIFVFGFDLMLSLCASVIFASVVPDISLAPLVFSWLAPMTFLSALALLWSVITEEPVIGAMVGFGLWVALIAARYWNTRLAARFQITLPDLLSAQTRPLLLIMALPIFIAAFWFSNRKLDFNKSMFHG